MEGACRVSFDFGYPLPLEDIPLVDHLIDVVMAQEPGGEAAPLAHRFQKIGERVRVVAVVDLRQDAAGEIGRASGRERVF